MENLEVKEKKENKKIIRLTIGIGLIVLSCATGLISGIQIAKNSTPNIVGSESGSENPTDTSNQLTTNQHVNEIIQLLKENRG